MYIRIGYDIIFNFPAPTPMNMLLYVLPSQAGALLEQDEIKTDPLLPVSNFIDCFGNRCARIVAPQGRLRVTNDTVVEDSGLPNPAAEGATQAPVQDLPPEVLQFLLPSRYCEVDKLTDTAWELFQEVTPGWTRVQAIRDWVHNNVEFGYQHASATKTAFDVYQDRTGVCRDLTHLSVTFCRAMGIPTRYSTGYLGDIGVPVNPAPMDFSACYEVYLDGKWHLFDSRHKERRIGWILMATGRDAADCAIVTSFGPHTLEKFEVWTDQVDTPKLAELAPRV